jgi:hypothetical protein
MPRALIDEDQHRWDDVPGQVSRRSFRKNPAYAALGTLCNPPIGIAPCYVDQHRWDDDHIAGSYAYRRVAKGPKCRVCWVLAEWFTRFLYMKC